MDWKADGSRLLRFSTADPSWRETFGQQCAHIDIKARSDQPVQHSAALLALRGLGVLRCRSGTPARWDRTSRCMQDQDDSFVLLMPLTGPMGCSQRGQDIEVERNAGVCILHDEPASIEFHRLSHLALMVPRAALGGLVRNFENASKRLIPASTDALRLLRSYLTLLRADNESISPALSHTIVPHIHDLIAVAIGATRDGTELALGRGVRAARLKAVKDDLTAQPSLPLAALAERQGITPRYVQLLFETEGTTFTAYALDQRLSRAHRLLTNPRYVCWTISTIAFEAGFGDLSHFNRNFRRRYGASPSEVRAGILN